MTIALPSHALANALPHVQPAEPSRRLLLFAIRRTGAQGLHDAAAAHAFMTGFGKDFRRPLVLLRALMADLSRASANPIQIAPWCCPRMTAPEGTLLEVLATVETQPDRADLLLADMLGVRCAAGVAATAHMLAVACRDQGLPLD